MTKPIKRKRSNNIPRTNVDMSHIAYDRCPICGDKGEPCLDEIKCSICGDPLNLIGTEDINCNGTLYKGRPYCFRCITKVTG